MTAIALLALALAGAETNTNWPGFLGGGAATLRENSLPLTWSPTQNIAWQVSLPGHGQSSPVVWNGKVFVTAVEGPMKDNYHVLAFDLNDGKPLWKHSLESTDKVKESYFVSRAAPTPVCDERALYVFFESGDVTALSHDGRELWRRSLANDYGKFKNEFGLAASPVQTEDAVILLIDHDGPSCVTALSKADGKTLWKTDRSPRRSWASPALVTIGGRPQIVCSSAGSVDGYDPATGELLWTFAEVIGNTSSTPLPFAEGTFLVGASPGNDGGARSEGAKKSNLAMTIDVSGGKPEPRVLWRTEEVTPTFGSPVVYAGHAYWINRVGAVFCFDAETGESRFSQRVKQSCWATPLGSGDRLYCFGKDGVTSVLRAGPKFEVLAENQLWDPATVKPDPAKAAAEDTEERRKSAAMFSGRTLYGVAAAQNAFLIRTGDVLYCVREPIK